MTKQEKIYDLLCRRIADILNSSGGALPADRRNRLPAEADPRKLPTEGQMCEAFGVSRQTLRGALSRLRSEHIIESRQGSGYTLTGLYPGRTNGIAVLIPSDEDYTHPVLISEITRHFDRLHFQVSVFLTGGDAGTERSVLAGLLSSPPRGLFAFVKNSALPSPNADLYHALSDAGTAVVFPQGRFPNVMTGKTSLPDNRQGGFELAAHLLSLGHRNIAFLLISGDIEGQERYLGGCRALIENGIPLQDSLVVRIPPSLLSESHPHHFSAGMQDLLSILPRRATALICQNDELAFRAVRLFERSSIPVPDAVSVAGFDNSHLRSVGSIRLTTMEQAPLTAAGSACAVMESMILPGSVFPAPNRWLLVRGGSSSLCTPSAYSRSPF